MQKSTKSSLCSIKPDSNWKKNHVCVINVRWSGVMWSELNWRRCESKDTQLCNYTVIVTHISATVQDLLSSERASVCMFHELDETRLCIGGTERSVSSDLSALLIILAIRDVKYRKTKVLVQAFSAFFKNSFSRFFVKQTEWIEPVTLKNEVKDLSCCNCNCNWAERNV